MHYGEIIVLCIYLYVSELFNHLYDVEHIGDSLTKELRKEKIGKEVFPFK